jgi:hypothetical protein
MERAARRKQLGAKPETLAIDLLDAVMENRRIATERGAPEAANR